MSLEFSLIEVSKNGEVTQVDPFVGQIGEVRIYADSNARPLLEPNHGDELTDTGLTYRELNEVLQRINNQEAVSTSSKNKPQGKAK